MNELLRFGICDIILRSIQLMCHNCTASVSSMCETFQWNFYGAIRVTQSWLLAVIPILLLDTKRVSVHFRNNISSRVHQTPRVVRFDLAMSFFPEVPTRFQVDRNTISEYYFIQSSLRQLFQPLYIYLTILYIIKVIKLCFNIL